MCSFLSSILSYVYMMKMSRIAATILILLTTAFSYGQFIARNTRQLYKIPELSYAVVSSDSVYELQAIGVKKINTDRTASLNDRFRIGSNTKAITGFIAALLVKQGKISWDTKFFDLFPEMKAKSRKEYQQLTLLNLLTFRAKLFPYTYTDKKPVKGQFSGNETEQRYKFTQWFFKQEPIHKTDSVCFSNLGYVAAGLMLEKASGKPYKQLLRDLGTQLGIDFQYGQPNFTDSLQTWGHNTQLIPEPPGDNYRLNWLLPAGNINMTLPDYVKFIQLQLRGLQGRSDMLSKEEFNFLHYGLAQFSVGWFQDTDKKDNVFSYNIGNPGTFLTQVYVFKDANKAVIMFSNAQTDDADHGLTILLRELEKKYGL